VQLVEPLADLAASVFEWCDSELVSVTLVMCRRPLNGCANYNLLSLAIIGSTLFQSLPAICYHSHIRAAGGPMAEDDELLTVAEVAQRLKLHQETVRRWIREGKLPAIRLGRTQAGYRVRKSDLQLFLAGSKQLELPGDDSGKLVA
jgi:excisionase family DNA binding protein